MLAAIGCRGPAGPDPGPSRRPDILLILVDALRRDHLGVYGYDRPTTPFLDELAARGVVFDDALSQAPQTLNSTASMFTSRSFPWLLRGVAHEPIPGVASDQREQWSRTPRLAEANTTMAEVLRGGGYETLALFNNPHHHATSGFDQGFAHARLLPRDPDQAYARVTSVADALLDWHAARDHDRPYFAYLHLMDPHNPYRPPAEYEGLFDPGNGRYHYVNGPAPSDFADRDLAFLTALYDAEIRFLDDELGRLLGELEARDGDGAPLVIVTADHGDELLDHGGLGHGKTVELEQLRIPLLMSGGPVEHASGRRVDGLVRNLDLAPTIVELAGLDPPAEFEGSSLLPLLTSDSTPEPPRISFAWNARLRSLTSTDWHCMRDLADDELTLYHRPSDPTGMVDVSADHPEIAALCVAELDRLETERVASVARANQLKALETVAPESAEDREQLEALGYVE